MKNEGSLPAVRRRWRVVLAASLALCAAGGVSLYQQARRHDARQQAAFERRVLGRLAMSEQRVRALEIERDFRECLLERPFVPVAVDAPGSKGRRAEAERELARIEAEIAELKARMIRIPVSAIEAIPEGKEVAAARQAAATAAWELSDIESHSQPDSPAVERKRREKERLDQTLSALVEDDLARRKNLAYKSLEDSLLEKAEAKKVLEEECDRLKGETGALDRPVPSSRTKQQAAMATFERDLSADPSSVPPETGEEDSSDFPISVFLLGSLLGVMVVLFAGADSGREASEEKAARAGLDAFPGATSSGEASLGAAPSSQTLRLDAGGTPVVR